MTIITLLVPILVFTSSATSMHRHHHHQHHNIHSLSDEYIDLINRSQKSWRAGRNFHRDIPISYIEGLMGTIVDEDNSFDAFMDEPPTYKVEELPENFWVLEQWPYCDSMSSIRDQGSCGSCWAVAVASAMTDRVCIVTSGAETDYISDEDILSCCVGCSLSQKPCDGGYTERAWAFTKSKGVVSGGVFNSNGGCRAYEVKPCNHTTNTMLGKYDQCTTTTKFQRCQKECTTNKVIHYSADKRRFSLVYKLPYDSYERVPKPMADLYENGPITATFTVYEDFMHYKGGVYRRNDAIPNKTVGNHTVKILGWGVESGIKYWYAANSWNYDWGDNGFFKIVRGENHCNIESYMSAGKA